MEAAQLTSVTSGRPDGLAKDIGSDVWRIARMNECNERGVIYAERPERTRLNRREQNRAQFKEGGEYGLSH